MNATIRKKSYFMNSKNYLIDLYPSKESKYVNQIEPLFNYDGTKVSFLSQSNDLEKHFDLYITDIAKCNDCERFYTDYKDNPEELNYIKIDNFIINDEYKEYLRNPISNFTSYCWHPSRNILFYIKKDG